MKRNIFTPLLLMILTLSGYTLPSASAAAPQRTVRYERLQGTRIAGVSIAGGLEIDLQQGTQTGVRLEVDSRLEEYLICELNNGTLTLRLKPLPRELRNIHGTTVKGTVTINRLEMLNISGGATIWCKGQFTGDNCRVISSGGADVNDLNWKGSGTFNGQASGGADLTRLRIEAPRNIELVCSGGSDISVEAYTDNLVVRASGGSDIYLSGTVTYADVVCSGGSDAHVKGLNVEDGSFKTSGGSDIYGR